MTKPQDLAIDQRQNGYPPFTSVFGGKSEHRCWYSLGDRSEMEAKETGSDLATKAEKRILGALWPSGAYTNREQMLISREETRVQFTCVWCKDTLSIHLTRPRPEVVYIPQIRVETIDTERILSMYSKLSQILTLLETSPDSSPQISKETHPELCKSRDKYFVAPVNILQAVGFERGDGIYKVPQNASPIFPGDMRKALESEIEALTTTGGDCDLSTAWLPWETGALTSRIYHYVDRVKVHLETLIQQFEVSGPSVELLFEAKKTWSWTASYWYFEYYSIIRSDYRLRANLLLNSASGLVCHVHKQLSHCTDLSLCFGYRRKEAFPPSLIRVHGFVTSFIQALWCCSETYRSAVLAVQVSDAEKDSEFLWFCKLQRLLAHMTFGKYNSYDAKFVLEMCECRITSSKNTNPLFSQGLTPHSLLSLLTTSVSQITGLAVVSCIALQLDPLPQSLKLLFPSAMVEVLSLEDLMELRESAVFHIALKPSQCPLAELDNFSRIQLQFDCELMSDMKGIFSEIQSRKSDATEYQKLVESLEGGWDKLKCKGDEVKVVCAELLRCGEERERELNMLKEKYDNMLTTISNSILNGEDPTHGLSSISWLLPDGSAYCMSRDPCPPHVWYHSASDKENIQSYDVISKLSSFPTGTEMHLFYEAIVFDTTSEGSQQQHHCWASIVSESESADQQCVIP